MQEWLEDCPKNVLGHRSVAERLVPVVPAGPFSTALMILLPLSTSIEALISLSLGVRFGSSLSGYGIRKALLIMSLVIKIYAFIF